MHIRLEEIEREISWKQLVFIIKYISNELRLIKSIRELPR